MKRLLPTLGVVFRKELLDGIRDRRSILSALLPLAVAPVMILFALNTASDRMERAQSLTVPVVGAEHASALIEWLEQQPGVAVGPASAHPIAEVREGIADFVLVIPDDFGQRFAAAKTAEVRLVVDSADMGTGSTVGRLRRLIEAYSRQLAQQRLIVRGVSPEVIRPVRIETVELSTSRERAAMTFAFIPMFLLIAVFAGGL